MSLRALTWLVSLALHMALGWSFVRQYETLAYAAGGGTDEFVAEQGIAIEGVAMMGTDAETVQAVEAEPVEASQAQPEIEEVKAEEVVEETKVITSAEGPEQEELPEEVQEVRPQERQVAMLEQEAAVPVEQKIAATAEKHGGDASAIKAYFGTLNGHLTKKAAAPRQTFSKAVVWVRFVINPDGTLVSRVVETSSGNKLLDDAALASIDRASPFPPVPADVGPGTFEARVPILFVPRKS